MIQWLDQMIDTLDQDSQEFLGNEFSKEVKKKERERSYCNLSLSLSLSLSLQNLWWGLHFIWEGKVELIGRGGVTNASRVQMNPMTW